MSVPDSICKGRGTHHLAVLDEVDRDIDFTVLTPAQLLPELVLVDELVDCDFPRWEVIERERLECGRNDGVRFELARHGANVVEGRHGIVLHVVLVITERKRCIRAKRKQQPQDIVTLDQGGLDRECDATGELSRAIRVLTSPKESVSHISCREMEYART